MQFQAINFQITVHQNLLCMYNQDTIICPALLTVLYKFQVVLQVT